MKLSCVTVCVNYSDFLCWSLLSNRSLFDEWIVVSDNDKQVKQMCSYYGATYVEASLWEDGKFLKYKGINEGIKALRHKDWVLFLDADIILPPVTKRVLQNIQLEKNNLYGIDRINITGIENWISYVNNPNLIQNNWLVDLSKHEVGSRICHYYGNGETNEFSGWKPLGFFQLAHYSKAKTYPQECDGADHCDVVFANQWERNIRILIPEIVGVHLESVDNTWGLNWKGRKSSPFNYPPVDTTPVPIPNPLVPTPWVNPYNPYPTPQPPYKIGDFPPFNNDITITYGKD